MPQKYVIAALSFCFKQGFENSECVYEKEEKYLQNWWEFLLCDVIGAI